MHTRLRVELGARSYWIHIAPGGLAKIGAAMTETFGAAKRTLVVTNEVVAPLYLDCVLGSLQEAGWEAHACVLPDGEQEKTVQRWGEVIDALMELRLARDEPLVALGGGVIGDLAGFAAATYRRGIPYVQVPTTLLAQVDSSVGGKTAVNHPLGKNMIGAFHQPQLVWMDPRTLRTLPARELRAGFAEVVKYGLIRDAALFAWLEQHAEEVLGLADEALVHAIAASCRNKAEIVARDEREAGERALLNLGHTFGHALERLVGYGQWLHGEAVAVGMRMAARLSRLLGLCDEEPEKRLCALLERAGLPLVAPRFAWEAWREAMGHDKKAQGTRLRFVLLRGIGKAFVEDAVPEDAVRRVVEELSQA